MNISLRGMISDHRTYTHVLGTSGHNRLFDVSQPVVTDWHGYEVVDEFVLLSTKNLWQFQVL